MFKQYNIKLTYKSNQNFSGMFSKLKDKIPKDKQTHVVYKIPCQNCNSVYIGQTQQLLSERIKGHKYAKNSTALKKHSENKKHSFNFNDVKIINKETKYKARNILEMIQIKNHPNAVNDRTEIKHLSKIYNSIL